MSARVLRRFQSFLRVLSLLSMFVVVRCIDYTRQYCISYAKKTPGTPFGSIFSPFRFHAQERQSGERVVRKEEIGGIEEVRDGCTLSVHAARAQEFQESGSCVDARRLSRARGDRCISAHSQM